MVPDSLTSSQFSARYKKDMLKLSASAVHFLKQRTSPITTRYSSYGDVPIVRNLYGIPKRTWKEWQTDPKAINFMGDDSPGIENPFASELNVNTPSAYYFLPSGKNLAYMLFQIEVNKARSDKELILFVTPRFVGKNNSGRPINSELAEASAIFPFFSGANGLWLWEKSTDRSKSEDEEVLPTYRAFFKGLERLSENKRFFTGDYKLHFSHTAHAAFSDKLPVWRSVVKGNEILISAQNPYAKPGVETTLTIQYEGWEKEIKLIGKEVFLDHFKL